MKPSDCIKRSAVEKRVGQLYANIWEIFSDDEYKNMAESIWYEMFRLHDPLAEYISGKQVLDAGCGGGSGVIMMLKEGAVKVMGVDLSEQALNHCERITKKFCSDKVEKVKFQKASVLELPFKDETFDFVYSNGVLHHTANPEKGFAELVRCLKPGGTLWVGVYGAGGLMTSVLIPLARAFRKIVPYGLTKHFLELFTKNPLSLYRILDPMYTPYRFAYHPENILSWIQKYGLVEPFRTHRCSVSFYQYGPWMSGMGWIGFRTHKPG